MIKRHMIAEGSVFLALIAIAVAPAITNAQNATPWWQKMVKKVVHKAEQNSENAITTSAKPVSKTPAVQRAAQTPVTSGSTAKVGDAPTVASGSVVSVTYRIDFKVGNATITGTITTDGVQGALSHSDLLGYDLKFSNPHDKYYYAGNSTKEPGVSCGKFGCGVIVKANSLMAGRGSVNFGRPGACCDHMTFQGIPFGHPPKIEYDVAAGNWSTYGNREDLARGYESTPFMLTAP